MPTFLAAILESRWFVLVARLTLAFVFWSGGLAGILEFGSRVAEMRAAGLPSPELVTVAVVATELVGTALLLINRWSWLGAGMLSVFLALTIPVAHPFWARPQGPVRTEEFFLMLEHISVIGGLMMAAILGRRLASPAPATAP
jgi:transmembrane protein